MAEFFKKNEKTWAEKFAHERHGVVYSRLPGSGTVRKYEAEAAEREFYHEEFDGDRYAYCVVWWA